MMEGEFASLTRLADAHLLTDVAADPDIVVVEAPVDANVWKVQVSEGDEVSANQIITILEAMKLEINVNAPDDVSKATVEKIIMPPGEQVKAGGKLVLLRKQS